MLRNVLLGLLLGALQLLVIGDALSLWHWPLPWWLYVVVGALLYLLIPAYAGFLASRQRGDDNTGVGAGCLVGAVSILMVLMTVVLVYYQTRTPCGGCNPGLLPALIFLSETMGGTIVTVLGGSLGETLGLRQFLARYQSSGREQHQKV
ncbi:MAG TPA: hypothetical protein VH590_17275 [Ktedonobacterales bacterium]